MKKQKKEQHTFLLSPDGIVIGNDNYNELSIRQNGNKELPVFGFFMMSLECAPEDGRFLREALQTAVDLGVKHKEEIIQFREQQLKSK